MQAPVIYQEEFSIDLPLTLVDKIVTIDGPSWSTLSIDTDLTYITTSIIDWYDIINPVDVGILIVKEGDVANVFAMNDTSIPIYTHQQTLGISLIDNMYCLINAGGLYQYITSCTRCTPTLNSSFELFNSPPVAIHTSTSLRLVTTDTSLYLFDSNNQLMTLYASLNAVYQPRVSEIGVTVGVKAFAVIDNVVVTMMTDEYGVAYGQPLYIPTIDTVSGVLVSDNTLIVLSTNEIVNDMTLIIFDISDIANPYVLEYIPIISTRMHPILYQDLLLVEFAGMVNIYSLNTTAGDTRLTYLDEYQCGDNVNSCDIVAVITNCANSAYAIVTRYYDNESALDVITFTDITQHFTSIAISAPAIPVDSEVIRVESLHSIIVTTNYVVIVENYVSTLLNNIRVYTLVDALVTLMSQVSLQLSDVAIVALYDDTLLVVDGAIMTTYSVDDDGPVAVNSVALNTTVPHIVSVTLFNDRIVILSDGDGTNYVYSSTRLLYICTINAHNIDRMYEMTDEAIVYTNGDGSFSKHEVTINGDSVLTMATLISDSVLTMKSLSSDGGTVIAAITYSDGGIKVKDVINDTLLSVIDIDIVTLNDIGDVEKIGVEIVGVEIVGNTLNYALLRASIVVINDNTLVTLTINLMTGVRLYVDGIGASSMTVVNTDESGIIYYTSVDDSGISIRALDIGAQWHLTGTPEGVGEYVVSVTSIQPPTLSLSTDVIKLVVDDTRLQTYLPTQQQPVAYDDTNPGEYAIIMFCSIFLLFSVIVYFGARIRCHDRTANNAVIVSSAISVVDLITDIAFIVWIPSESSSIYYASLSFLIITVVVSMVSCFILMKKEIDNMEFFNWYTRHRTVVTIIFATSSINIGFLNMISSRIFNSNSFRAPISKRGDVRLKVLTLCTIFIEDIPQLTLQVLVINGNIGTSPIVWASLVMSSISLLFSVSRKAMTCLEANRVEERNTPSTCNRDSTTDVEVTIQRLHPSFTCRTVPL